MSPRTNSTPGTLSRSYAASGFRVSTRTLISPIAASRRAIALPINPDPPAMATIFAGIGLLLASPVCRKGRARNELAAAARRIDLAIRRDRNAARYCQLRPAGDFEPLERIIVRPRVHLAALDH